MRLAPGLVDLRLVREGSVQAQHDSQSKGFLAYCNKVAHDLAAKEMDNCADSTNFWNWGPGSRGLYFR